LAGFALVNKLLPGELLSLGKLRVGLQVDEQSIRMRARQSVKEHSRLAEVLAASGKPDAAAARMLPKDTPLFVIQGPNPKALPFIKSLVAPVMRVFNVPADKARKIDRMLDAWNVQLVGTTAAAAVMTDRGMTFLGVWPFEEADEEKAKALVADLQGGSEVLMELLMSLMPMPVTIKAKTAPGEPFMHRDVKVYTYMQTTELKNPFLAAPQVQKTETCVALLKGRMALASGFVPGAARAGIKKLIDQAVQPDEGATLADSVAFRKALAAAPDAFSVGSLDLLGLLKGLSQNNPDPGMMMLGPMIQAVPGPFERDRFSVSFRDNAVEYRSLMHTGNITKIARVIMGMAGGGVAPPPVQENLEEF